MLRARARTGRRTYGLPVSYTCIGSARNPGGHTGTACLACVGTRAARAGTDGLLTAWDHHT
jgi:hypothetical protein